MTTFYNKLKNPPPELNHVIVMVSRGLGKVRSFNIYFPALLGIVVAFAVYFLLSFLLFAHYLGERQQENMLVQLEKEFQKTQNALHQAKERLKFLENYIDPSKIPDENLKGVKKSKAYTPKSFVSIKELKTRRTDDSLSVAFKLVRSGPGRSSIRGYVFMVAVDGATTPPRMWPFPKAVFKNGLPVDPKKGETYKIRNFRQIRARWSFEAPEKTPSEVMILVYNRAGQLLLKKDFHLEEE